MDDVAKMELVQWLNKYINTYIDLNRLSQFRDVRTADVCIPDTVHIFEGIEQLADALGVTLEYVNARDGRKDAYFYYRGKKVFQIMKMEEE